MSTAHQIPARDTVWHEESVLISSLATLNRRISLYITATLDADAGRTSRVSLVDEDSLGQRLVELGQALKERSNSMRTTGETPTEPPGGG